MRRLVVASLMCVGLASACTPRAALRGPQAPQPVPVAVEEAPEVSATVQPKTQAARLGLSTTLDRTSILADKPSRVFARVRIDTADVPVPKRGPLQLTLLVDTSGSMVGDPIEEARAAAKALLGSLRDGDRLAIVTFDSTANVLVAPFVVDRSKLGPVEAAIDGMAARGTTDLTAGLGVALQHAIPQVAGVASRIVLLGDGVPNDPSAIPMQIQQAKANGISISALGFGLEYDETVLAALAQGTGGRFHRIDPEETITAAFTEEITRIERTVASNVQIRVVPGPGVAIRRIVGHPTAPDSARAHTAQLGDLAEGQAHEVFVELEIGPHRDTANVELVDTQLSFDDRTTGSGRQQQTAFLATTASTAASQPNRDVTIGVALARVAAASVEAISRSNALDFRGADALLKAEEVQSRKLAASLDEAKLLHEADELAKLRRVLGEARRRHDAATREAARAAKQQARLGARMGRAPSPDLGTVPVAPAEPSPVARPAMAAPAPASELDVVKRAHGRAFDMLQAR